MLTQEHQQHAQRNGWDVVLCVDEKTRRVFFDLCLYPQPERWSRTELFNAIAARAKSGDAVAISALKLLASPATKPRKK